MYYYAFLYQICSVLSCKEVYIEGACGCNYSGCRNRAPYSENSDLRLLVLLQWELKRVQELQELLQKMGELSDWAAADVKQRLPSGLQQVRVCQA